jgi:hypothetical protein
MHFIDVYGCTAGAAITLRVINPKKMPDTVTFNCDDNAGTVQANFGTVGTQGAPSATSNDPYAGSTVNNGALPPKYSVSVSKSTITAPSGITGVTAGTTGTRFTIGYWDPGAIMTNWWEPIVVSKGSGLTVVISTKQEGGYVNAVAKSSSSALTAVPSKPSVLQQILSLFISTSVTASTTIQLGWTDSTGASQVASVTTTGAGIIPTSTDSTGLAAIINTVASLTTSTGVASVSSTATAHGSNWNEYQITFAPSSTTTYFRDSLQVLSVGGGAGISSAFVTTFTKYDNYPWFYDNPYGYYGSGR